MHPDVLRITTHPVLRMVRGAVDHIDRTLRRCLSELPLLRQEFEGPATSPRVVFPGFIQRLTGLTSTCGRRPKGRVTCSSYMEVPVRRAERNRVRILRKAIGVLDAQPTRATRQYRNRKDFSGSANHPRRLRKAHELYSRPVGRLSPIRRRIDRYYNCFADLSFSPLRTLRPAV